MSLWQVYLRPQNLTEALDALATATKPVAPIAGGTDLLLDLRQGRRAPVHTLVDLNSVTEMTALEMRLDELFIGSSVPISRIARDPGVGARFQALTDASALIAGPQVRNVATLGGNVAHALPAADGTIALLALGASVEIADQNGIRRAPIRDLFLDVGKSSLKHGQELIVGFYLQTPRISQTLRVSSAFKRIMRPQGVALPILNVAVWLAREDNLIADIRIAIGPAAAIPFRATEAEDGLRGQPLNAKTIERAIESILSQARFRTSPRRASAEYRQRLVGALFKDTIQSAWERINFDD